MSFISQKSSDDNLFDSKTKIFNDNQSTSSNIVNNINDNNRNFGDNGDASMSTNDATNIIAKIFVFCSYLLVVSAFPFSLFLCLKVIYEYERVVVFRLGKLTSTEAQGPGLFFTLPCIDDYSIVDLRTITYDVPPQEFLTKDSMTVSVDAVLFYRIWLPTIAVSNVYDYAKATKMLTLVTLRNILGTKTLSEILSQRTRICLDMSNMVDNITKSWGVKIERVEIKDVRLPVSLQRTMAVEAEATRNARAKIIAAKGDLDASYGYKEASELLSEEPISLQLRFMQQLASNSFDKDTTILFPVPIPMLT